MGQKKLSLREATVEDIHQFAMIKAKAYSEDREKTKPMPGQIPEWYDGEWYVGLGIVDEVEAKRLIENEDCYIIILEQVPIGIFWLHKEEKDSYSLEDFCILPEYQGKGYGSETLTLIEQLHPNNHKWMLSTPEFCTRNRYLYEKMGYQMVGTCSKGTVILYEKEIYHEIK